MFCSRRRGDDFGLFAKEEEVIILDSLQPKKK
jgi:hypothetical protein